jgi:sugar lactone lactonase YvrE
MIALLLFACGSDEPKGPVTDPACEPASGRSCIVAGDGTAGLGLEGEPAIDSHLYLPIDLSIGPEGLPYILDWNNHRIRRLDEGVMVTVAGSGMLGDGPEGPALAASFNHPTNLAFDDQGRMIISAWHNSRIETVDLDSGALSFIGGDGLRGYDGDALTATESTLDLPSSVAIGEDGAIYFADQANQLIRKLEDGIIYDVAGQQRMEGYSGDGGDAMSAQFYASVGQAADPSSRIVIDGQTMYMADTGNHVIRTIDMDTWTVDTYAGSRTCDEDNFCVGAIGNNADGAPLAEAAFTGPTDVAVGPDGSVYIADTGNHCVRRVLDDKVVTVAGVCGSYGVGEDGLAATETLLQRPYGIAVDDDGLVYIADTFNHYIRVVYP